MFDSSSSFAQNNLSNDDNNTNSWRSPLGTTSSIANGQTTLQKSKFFQDITLSSPQATTNGTGNSSSKSSNRSARFQRKDPAQIARASVSELLPDAHVLPYTWTIYYHSRKNRTLVRPEDGNAGENAEGFADLESTTKQPDSAASANTVTAANTNADPNADPVAPLSTSVDSYLQKTTEIEFPEVGTKDVFNGLQKTTVNIASIEQLWEALSLIKRANELPYGSELFIFKSGVEPVWEDKINSKGGRWRFKFSRKVPYQYNSNISEHSKETDLEFRQLRKRNALVWERLVLRILGGSLIPEDNINGELVMNDISGLVLSIRRDEDIITVWNTNLCFDRGVQDHYFKSILKSNPFLKNPLNNNDDTKNSNENSEQQQQQQQSQTPQKKPILFNEKRLLCSAVLSTIREVDQLLKGSDIATTRDVGSTQRVGGVNFEYKFHNDTSNNNSVGSNASHDSNRTDSDNNHNNNHHGGGHHHNNHNNHNNRNNSNYSNNNSSNRRYNKYHNNNSNNNNNSSNLSGQKSYSTYNNNNSEQDSSGELSTSDASKIFDSGSFANLGRRRRLNKNGENGDEPRNLMSIGSKRRLQNLQRSNSNTSINSNGSSRVSNGNNDNA